MNAIALNHICKSFGSFAIQDLTLEVPEGTICGLVGENGAGKSTTLRLIMNTITRDSGEITVLGQDNRSDAFRELKNDIGVVLDEAYFPEVLNPRQGGPTPAGTRPPTPAMWTGSPCPGSSASRTSPGA